MPFRPLGLDDPMPFGKHKGCLLSEILTEEPWYIGFLIKKTDIELTQEVIDAAAACHKKSGVKRR